VAQKLWCGVFCARGQLAVCRIDDANAMNGCYSRRSLRCGYNWKSLKNILTEVDQRHVYCKRVMQGKLVFSRFLSFLALLSLALLRRA